MRKQTRGHRRRRRAHGRNQQTGVKAERGSGQTQVQTWRHVRMSCRQMCVVSEHVAGEVHMRVHQCRPSGDTAQTCEHCYDRRRQTQTPADEQMHRRGTGRHVEAGVDARMLMETEPAQTW